MGDKDSLWTHPVTSDGWMHAHNMIRGEVNKMISGLKSASQKFPNASPDWVVDSIKQIWTHHYDVVMDHHRNEDEIMNPFMKTRVKLPTKLEADHEILITKMRSVKNAVEKLVPDTSSSTSLDNVITLLEDYRNTMFPHLEEEEQIALPLLRAYFTPDEVGKKVQEIMQTSGAGEIGSFIDAMGEDYFRSTFMPQEGTPFFVWYLKFRSDHYHFVTNVYLKFRSDHYHFVTNVKCHFDALKDGTPMSVPRKGTFLC